MVLAGVGWRTKRQSSSRPIKRYKLTVSRDSDTFFAIEARQDRGKMSVAHDHQGWGNVICEAGFDSFVCGRISLNKVSWFIDVPYAAILNVRPHKSQASDGKAISKDDVDILELTLKTNDPGWLWNGQQQEPKTLSLALSPSSDAKDAAQDLRSRGRVRFEAENREQRAQGVRTAVPENGPIDCSISSPAAQSTRPLSQPKKISARKKSQFKSTEDSQSEDQAYRPQARSQVPASQILLPDHDPNLSQVQESYERPNAKVDNVNEQPKEKPSIKAPRKLRNRMQDVDGHVTAETTDMKAPPVKANTKPKSVGKVSGPGHTGLPAEDSYTQLFEQNVSARKSTGMKTYNMPAKRRGKAQTTNALKLQVTSKATPQSLGKRKTRSSNAFESANGRSQADLPKTKKTKAQSQSKKDNHIETADELTEAEAAAPASKKAKTTVREIDPPPEKKTAKGKAAARTSAKASQAGLRRSTTASGAKSGETQNTVTPMAKSQAKTSNNTQGSRVSTGKLASVFKPAVRPSRQLADQSKTFEMKDTQEIATDVSSPSVGDQPSMTVVKTAGSTTTTLDPPTEHNKAEGKALSNDVDDDFEDIEDVAPVHEKTRVGPKAAPAPSQPPMTSDVHEASISNSIDNKSGAENKVNKRAGAPDIAANDSTTRGSTKLATASPHPAKLSASQLSKAKGHKDQTTAADKADELGVGELIAPSMKAKRGRPKESSASAKVDDVEQAPDLKRRAMLNTQTPQAHGRVRQDLELPDDDSNRKANLVGFGTRGPLNQGSASPKKRQKHKAAEALPSAERLEPIGNGVDRDAGKSASHEPTSPPHDADHQMFSVDAQDQEGMEADMAGEEIFESYVGSQTFAAQTSAQRTGSQLSQRVSGDGSPYPIDTQLPRSTSRTSWDKGISLDPHEDKPREHAVTPQQLQPRNRPSSFAPPSRNPDNELGRNKPALPIHTPTPAIPITRPPPQFDQETLPKKTDPNNQQTLVTQASQAKKLHPAHPSRSNAHKVIDLTTTPANRQAMSQPLGPTSPAELASILMPLSKRPHKDVRQRASSAEPSEVEDVDNRADSRSPSTTISQPGENEALSAMVKPGLSQEARPPAVQAVKPVKHTTQPLREDQVNTASQLNNDKGTAGSMTSKPLAATTPAKPASKQQLDPYLDDLAEEPGHQTFVPIAADSSVAAVGLPCDYVSMTASHKVNIPTDRTQAQDQPRQATMPGKLSNAPIAAIPAHVRTSGTMSVSQPLPSRSTRVTVPLRESGLSLSSKANLPSAEHPAHHRSVERTRHVEDRLNIESSAPKAPAVDDQHNPTKSTERVAQYRSSAQAKIDDQLQAVNTSPMSGRVESCRPPGETPNAGSDPGKTAYTVVSPRPPVQSRSKFSIFVDAVRESQVDDTTESGEAAALQDEEDPERTLVEDGRPGHDMHQAAYLSTQHDSPFVFRNSGQAQYSSHNENHENIRMSEHSSSEIDSNEQEQEGEDGEEDQGNDSVDDCPDYTAIQEHMRWERALEPHQYEYHQAFARIAQVSICTQFSSSKLTSVPATRGAHPQHGDQRHVHNQGLRKGCLTTHRPT